jgi:hypothetical protein
MTNYREIDVGCGAGLAGVEVASASKVQSELERANQSRHGMHVKLGKHEAELDEMADWADDVNQRLSALETGSMNVRVDDHSTIDVTVQDPRVSDLQKQIDGLRAVLIQRVEELRVVDRHSSDRIDAATRRLNTAEVNVADAHLLARKNERRLDDSHHKQPATTMTTTMRKEAARTLRGQSAIEADLGNPGRAEYLRHAAEIMENS